ncbi:hypothetical protein [Pseudomonas savastanoi]|uniref:hypothetical protein n=1 Tax=Pseudomonas savastanoi TaxID=29438 RepID=UPI000F0001CB|nr:hypothetical protein [Pseudomonas savastanoi]RML39145.1 hypothetical protein ALQ97_200000 [Pseudomonas savastanoi pv. glycinea]RML90969.1 hypothetical protein ALQ87_200210 [Pseudomonas savastanoi pv. glycinea]RMM62893.1 hypothetical protein ALQ75_200194 [Pseudomonas savastanoi pv. glycinea]RMM96787.1 hypothetical protein ALQ68_200071 [Pseudomonas savastanoi pv. glycinea]RMQ04279.1 hypothetical protein ALQ13_102483 [Pseudomonas savastanoi pv. glycinea]
MSGISSYFRHTPTQQIEHNFDDLESGVQRHAPAVGDRLHRVGQSLLGISGQLLSDSMSNLPSMRSLGAMAGHGVQQLITCGGPTFAREQVLMHAYHAMLPVLAAEAKWALLGTQGVISLAKIGANLYRQTRMERLPESDVAVRGHFGLSQQQWDAKGEDEQNQLRAQHSTDSRNVTRNQVIAEAAFLVMSSLSLAKGDGAFAARVLATQMRNIIYAGSRESLQATICLTGSKHGNASHGVNESNMATNGWTYAAMTLAAGYLQDTVISNVLPKGQSVSGAHLNGADGKPLTGYALNNAVNMVAGVRALANSAIEFIDAYRGKHYDLKQVGDEQKLQEFGKKMVPMKDYERLLDHSIARLSWNNVSNAGVLALQQAAEGIGKENLPPGVMQFLGNAGTAAMFGATYRMVNQTYQAHAKMRAAWAAHQSGQPRQAEGPFGVVVDADPSEADSRSVRSASSPAASPQSQSLQDSEPHDNGSEASHETQVVRRPRAISQSEDGRPNVPLQGRHESLLEPGREPRSDGDSVQSTSANLEHALMRPIDTKGGFSQPSSETSLSRVQSSSDMQALTMRRFIEDTPTTPPRTRPRPRDGTSATTETQGTLPTTE